MGNELVVVLIVGPVADLYVAIFQVAECRDGKLRTLGDDFGTCIVFHALRGLALG